MILRPYQIEAIDNVRAEFAAGRKSVCLVIPTGGGKTAIASEIIRRTVAKGRRCLFLCHRAELVDQSYATLRGLGVAVGAMCAGSASPPQPHAPVQVATVQTLIARNQRPEASLIVCDEAHHFLASTFGALVRDYPRAHTIGLTATPERGDGKGLGGMFESIVVGARIKQLIELGHLVPANLIRPHRKLRSGEIAQRPVDAYLEHARGRRAIVFSPLVATAEEHAAQFRALGVPATMVEGNTDALARRQAFAALRSGATPVLTNVYIATEGFDIPAIECVILARGCGHAGTYLQMVGRGLRPSEGKTDCVVIDLQGISHDHGHPEDDREYSLEGRGISEPGSADPKIVQRYCKVCSGPLEPDDTVCPACGTECGGPPQVITGDKLEPYAWVRRDSDDKRAVRLAKWIAETTARVKADGTPWKETAALHKYKAVYGAWVPSGVLAEAKRILREKAAEPTQEEGWT